ncbi:hypothetical protein PMAYCL1PPCAC_20409, partial [Pristionchus mayeri]
DLKLMVELFRLGCRYREIASRGVDKKEAGEMRIDESIILRTISDDDDELESLHACRPILDCIYGRSNKAKAESGKVAVKPSVGGIRLNASQTRAVCLYADASGPRVFCVLSPPGSGKTTVAAAMAAEVACTSKGANQLLLSVQNVAVDNMGAALKKMDYGGGEVYNIKATEKLDPHCPTPFDFFDLMDGKTLDEWRTGRISLKRMVPTKKVRVEWMEKRCMKRHYEERQLSYEDALTFDRRKFEDSIHPKMILATVEMVLHKLYSRTNLKCAIQDVERVIIDEASLLTEAALFCLIRRFPYARIVLIGDNRQLPPFMYDSKILGHELAGRPALSAAMKTGKVPVVELNNVYRAPPSLVAPYNRLAYGGKLVSKKAEGEFPLSGISLIRSRMPQLLLIDVDGRQ